MGAFDTRVFLRRNWRAQVGRWRRPSDAPFRWSRWRRILFHAEKLRYWSQAGKAGWMRHHARRLLRALEPEAARVEGSMAGQDCLALLAEARGDLRGAVRHRRRQRRLCQRVLATRPLPSEVKRETSVEARWVLAAIRTLGVEADHVAGAVGADHADELGRVADVVAVEADDPIPRRQSGGAGGRPVGL